MISVRFDAKQVVVLKRSSCAIGTVSTNMIERSHQEPPRVFRRRGREQYRSDQPRSPPLRIGLCAEGLDYPNLLRPIPILQKHLIELAKNIRAGVYRGSNVQILKLKNCLDQSVFEFDMICVTWSELEFCHEWREIGLSVCLQLGLATCIYFSD